MENALAHLREDLLAREAGLNETDKLFGDADDLGHAIELVTLLDFGKACVVAPFMVLCNGDERALFDAFKLL